MKPAFLLLDRYACHVQDGQRFIDADASIRISQVAWLTDRRQKYSKKQKQQFFNKQEMHIDI